MLSKAKSFKVLIIALIVVAILMAGYMVTTMNESSEDVAKRVLEKLYTVEDYNELETMITEQNKMFENPSKYSKQDMYRVFCFGLADDLSEKGIEYMVRDRVAYHVRAMADENKVTFSVDNIELKKSTENPEKDLIVYVYDIKLRITYEDSSKRYIDVAGFINVLKINGKYKCGVISDKTKLYDKI